MATNYYPRLAAFLQDLAANNNRDWFRENRARYDELRALWLADIDRLIAFMAAWEPALAGLTASRASFRIYRDTRFSPDKTPYKTFFSAAMNPGGRGVHSAGYYLQCGIGEGTGLYGGIWCPEAPVLKKLRHAIVDNIEEWEEINGNPALNRHFTLVTSSSLKTAPKGWPKDHPQAEWLRMKDYGREAALDGRFFSDPSWPERAAEMFSLVKPFNDFLNYSAYEE